MVSNIYLNAFVLARAFPNDCLIGATKINRFLSISGIISHLSVNGKPLWYLGLFALVGGAVVSEVHGFGSDTNLSEPPRAHSMCGFEHHLNNSVLAI